MSNSNPSRPKSAPHLAYTDARHVFDEMTSWPPCTGACLTWPTRVQPPCHAPPLALLLQNQAPMCLLASLTRFRSPWRSSSARTHARARPPWMPPPSSLPPALLRSLGLTMPRYTLVTVHRPLLSLASPSLALLRRRSAVAVGAATGALPARVAGPHRVTGHEPRLPMGARVPWVLPRHSTAVGAASAGRSREPAAPLLHRREEEEEGSRA